MKALSRTDRHQRFPKLVFRYLPASNSSVGFVVRTILSFKTIFFNDYGQRAYCVDYLSCFIQRGYNQVQTVIARVCIEIVASTHGGVKRDVYYFFIQDCLLLGRFRGDIRGRPLNGAPFGQSDLALGCST